MGHLTELRKRITYVAIVVIVFMVAAFIFKDFVFGILLRPLKNTGVTELTTLGVTEAFMQVLKVSIYAGLICALPFILYEFWAFIMPALYENEKKSVIPYVILTTVLFIAGVAFAYFIVLPIGLKFMVGYGARITKITRQPAAQAENYISFVLCSLARAGVRASAHHDVLAWAGLVDHVKSRKPPCHPGRGIIAMVLTPSQDPVSMALMLIPLMVLYEFGIWLAKLAAKRKARGGAGRSAAAEHEGALPGISPAAEPVRFVRRMVLPSCLPLGTH
jgi:sec-independent protein translocase protein TatC